MTDNRDNAQKPSWWSATFADDFFHGRDRAPVPNAVIEFAAPHFGLDPAHCWLITCLCYWRFKPGPVFPSLKVIAQAVGRSEKQVRRYIRDLEEKGLVEVTEHYDKDNRRTTNNIDFEPMIDKINELEHFGLPEWAHTPRQKEE